MMKILTVLGARPQFVKAAVVSRAILRFGLNLEEIIVHTGQHYDHSMSKIFFEQMKIPEPDYNLGVADLGHGAMTGRMLEKLEAVMLDERPDRILVYGDTNSTLAGALAGAKLHIPIMHVEAGLRSFNMDMPEEINRVLTDRISSYLFCPTRTSIQNLEVEGFRKLGVRIVRAGDVMQDAAMFYSEMAQRPADVQSSLLSEKFVLATIHRAENTDDPDRLAGIVEAMSQIHETRMPVIVPLHPRTLSRLEDQRLELKAEVVNPVGYLEMLYLLERASLVMTDSGGLQKEAFFFRKPCVTIREETEWVELIQAKVNRLSGTNAVEIIKVFDDMIEREIVSDPDLYGGGRAAEKIVSNILD